MPFDSPRTWKTLTPAERCRSFADELEAWEKMGAVFPNGAEWDYSSCETCAMEYAIVTHDLDFYGGSSDVIAAWLGISWSATCRIFFCAHGVSITPSDIARLLREHADTLDG